MTIKVAATRNEFTATASQTIFNYTFKIFASGDLNVFITPAGQTCDDTTDITTAFTVLGVGDEDGGSITLTTPATVGDLVTIVSNIASSRTTDYQDNGDFIPQTVNDDLDRVVSLVKQAEETANRTLVTDECQQGPKPLKLDAPDALKFLRWKTDESGVEAIDLTVTGAPTNASVITYNQGGTGSVNRTAEDRLQEHVSVVDKGASPSATAGANATAFQATVNEFADATSGTIIVPGPGVYDLATNPTYGDRRITWDMRDGATTTTKNLLVNDQSILEKSGIRRIVKLNLDTTEAGHYIDSRSTATAGTTAYEKTGFLVIAQTDDNSSTSHSSGIAANRDTVGVGARGYISSTNDDGRAWGLNCFARIATGGTGDGLLHCIECNIENGGSDNAIPETAKAKYGINLTTKAGSNPGTAAIKVVKGGGAGWHKGFWANQAAFVNLPGSSFLELDGKFRVDRDGNVGIGTEDIDGKCLIAGTEANLVIRTTAASANGAFVNFQEQGVRNFSWGLDQASGDMRLTKAADVSANGIFEVRRTIASGGSSTHIEINDGTVTSLRRIEIGAVDSAGSGFRELKVTN